MNARRLITFGCTLLVGGAVFECCPAQQTIDGAFIQSTPERVAPNYDSDDSAESRLRGLNSAPEADARPGEYYFLEAARAFRRHDYKFAIEMYRVAASWAYKPAEYNLGVMYARGQGVEVDLPRALAWMALASERNEKHYVDAREVIYALMTKEQFDQANVIWRELKKTYGDAVALKRAKARWAEVRSHITGSRVGSVGNLHVGVAEQNGNLTSSPKLSHDIAVAAKRGEETRSGFKSAAQIEKEVNSSAYGGTTTSAEVLGGQGVDGSIAYRQLLQSDNPYDPKFRNLSGGVAIVGPPEPAKAKAKAEDHKSQDADQGDPGHH